MKDFTKKMNYVVSYLNRLGDYLLSLAKYINLVSKVGGNVR